MIAPAQKKIIQQLLEAYCEQRVPEKARNQIYLSYGIRGNNVTLFENRLTWYTDNKWIRYKLAQFRFNESTNRWSLYCLDRNEKWHYYSECDETEDLNALIQEVDKDPTGIFYG